MGKKWLTTEDATKMYHAFERAGMTDGNAASAVDAMLEAKREADHARRRQLRQARTCDEGLVDQLTERINHLEATVAQQGKVLAELVALHKEQANDADDDCMCYTNPAKWAAQQAAARATAQGPRLIKKIMDR